MAIFHLSIRNVSRTNKKSIIAKAAYRAGEKLLDAETHKTYDYTHKKEVVFSEILLCENAPKEYADRKKLWTAVQQVEKDSNSRLARDFEISFPKEFNLDLQKKIIKEYVQKNFVSQGMIADYSIHEKENNPHAHILVTTREIDENGKWKAKRKTDYARDENGEKIPILDENGKQKLGARNRKLYKRIEVDVNDWNKREKIEEWRKNWAEICNQYLSQENKIDHRSYKRQGKEQEPLPIIPIAQYHMQKRGIKLFCNWIEIRNYLIEQAKEKAKEIQKELQAKAESVKNALEKFTQRGKVNELLSKFRNGVPRKTTAECGGNERKNATSISELPTGTRRDTSDIEFEKLVAKQKQLDDRGIAVEQEVIARQNREDEQERRRIAESKRIEQEKQRQRDRTERKGNSEQPKRKRTFDIER